ncbi:MAG TPA: substrate-binding domain-containing protein [Burkholderiales bacterium]|nr:substrate-binding domain-containing protein [Burkholderiales bacterium]
MTIARIGLWVLVVAVLAAGSTAWAQSRADVTIYAPGRLKEPLEELAREFERQGRAKATLVYDPGPELARRIEQGAAADLLISDDPASLDMLAKQGLIRIETRVSLVKGAERSYRAAVVASTRSKTTYDYLRYLRSQAAQAVWERHGFSASD